MVQERRKQRLRPVDRRQLLLEATRDTLARYGAQGTGVREICKSIGVSPGLLTHYFTSKESLFIAAYENMAQCYLAEIEAIALQTDFAAEDRLNHLFRLYFSSRWVQSGTVGAYTGFWNLSQTIPALRTAFDETFRKQLDVFEGLVRDLLQERNLAIAPKPFATFLLVFLEGVWLESGLNPDAVDLDSVQAFCWDWLECYLAAKSTP